MIDNFIQELTPGKASLWLVGLFFLACLVRKFQVSAGIARLGTRAPRIPFRVPYGWLRYPLALVSLAFR